MPFWQRQLAGGMQVGVIRPVLDFVVKQINEHRKEQQVHHAEQHNGRQTAFALTTAERPSGVRSNPCTIHGWRPTSAANQPAWLAICGPRTESTSSHSVQRFSKSDPCQK